MVKIHLYCPPESTCKKLEADITLPGVPAVGDTIYCPELAPEAGPGASSYLFKVKSRCWTNRSITLTLTHVWELNSECQD